MSEEEVVRRRSKVVERIIRIGTENDKLGNSTEVIRAKRDHEKQVLIGLNERLSVYLERVKFLERQNTKLLSELDDLKKKQGLDSNRFKDTLEPALNDARVKIDEISRDKVAAEIKAKRNEYETGNYKKLHDDVQAEIRAEQNKVKTLENMLNENKTELDLLKRQKQSIESDLEKYKNQATNLNVNLVKLLNDLDNATLKRLKTQNEIQTMEEQIPFLNAVHEQEILELRSLQAGSHIDPAQFYRHELERAIRDIRGDFEQLSKENKRELEEWYKVKVEEIKNEQAKRQLVENQFVKIEEPLRGVNINELQNELISLRSLNGDLVKKFQKLDEDLKEKRSQNSLILSQKERDLEDAEVQYNETLMQMNSLMDNKISLEFEINTYRRLLDLESAKLSTKNVVVESAIVKEDKQNETSSSSSVMSAKTIFHKTAKGPIAITECTLDGKCIIIENVSKNVDVDLENWILKRNFAGSQDDVKFTIPKLVLKAGQTVKLWSKDHKNPEEFDLVNQSIDNWGLGIYILTTIIDNNGEEKSTHEQKMVFGI